MITSFRFLVIRQVLALLLGSLLSVPTVLAGVTAKVNENPLYTGDSLVLTLTSDSGDEAEPDLSPLEPDFRILGTGSSTQMRIINGNSSVERQWRVELSPRHSGKITIPPLQVGGARSQAPEVVVIDTPPAGERQEAPGNRHVSIDARVGGESGDFLLQQQISYVVHLYYDQSVIKGALDDPQVAGAAVERVGEDRSYTEMRDGRNYHVIERRYAIFPQHSGTLEIPAVRFEGISTQADQTRPGPGSLFDRFMQGTPFANDPFFSDGLFGPRGTTVRATGPALKVEVKPRAGAQPEWLPATAVHIDDDWADQAPDLKVGEPVERTITIKAVDQTGFQIPAPMLNAPPGMRVYPGKAEVSNEFDGAHLVGVRRQGLTYIPDVAGQAKWPEVRVDWWNTVTASAQTAVLPALDLTVKPGPTAASGKQNAVAVPVATPAPETAAQPVADPQKQPDVETMTEPEFWWWTGGALSLALILLIGNRLTKRGVRRIEMSPDHGEPEAAPDGKKITSADKGVLLGKLEHACRTRDAQAAARLLLELAEIRWPQKPPLSLGELARRLPAGIEEVRSLERYMYSENGVDWPADALCQVFRKGLPKEPAPTVTMRQSGNTLPPLYPA